MTSTRFGLLVGEVNGSDTPGKMYYCRSKLIYYWRPSLSGVASLEVANLAN